MIAWVPKQHSGDERLFKFVDECSFGIRPLYEYAPLKASYAKQKHCTTQQTWCLKQFHVQMYICSLRQTV